MGRDQESRLDDIAIWIEGCASGDKSALKALMDAEGPRMLGVARRMLRRVDLAEDAVQDSLVTIWRKAHQFDRTHGNAKGWVYAILRNRCLTMLRRDAWEIATESETLDKQRDIEIVEDAYERLDSTSDLRRCLERLEPQRRFALLSSYVLGYSHGEISGRMGAPLGSVKAWLRRGLAELRECVS